MNVENILKVADAIEQHSIPDLGFNMELYGKGFADFKDRSGYKCGTVACIAGWTAVVGGFRKPSNLLDAEGHKIKDFANDFFETDEDQGEELFAPDIHRDEVSPAQAVRILRHLAATGIVDWDLPEA